ncbi:hypothetical protein KNP414_05002 [Paenibacillus mucilaginosus KNP414]|uniref:Uncharacterized protein n=1 Tax=Paenibacillus mucilaginosus (strain KNP414) TaxID=1036673 RepID=F8FLF9_PAEMK|nr:hypothetical protein KNP414_05002 [Paenibacillus mucilaginosus KNP414]
MNTDAAHADHASNRCCLRILRNGLSRGGNPKTKANAAAFPVMIRKLRLVFTDL